MTKKEVAERFGIPVNDLKAVVFYSDRSYSNTWVFGAKRVYDHFDKMDSGPFKPKSLTHQVWSKLTSLPEDNCYPVDATAYGFESGKVILVPGRPQG